MMTFFLTQRGRDNENILNDSYMKNKVGQVVLFGDVIQVKKCLFSYIFPLSFLFLLALSRQVWKILADFPKYIS
jgi:hypothetical protein